MGYLHRKTWRLIEATTHAIGGFLIGFLVVGILDTLQIIVVNWTQNFWISVVITALNMLKAYYLRDYFHNKRNRHKKLHRRLDNEKARKTGILGGSVLTQAEPNQTKTVQSTNRGQC